MRLALAVVALSLPSHLALLACAAPVEARDGATTDSDPDAPSTNSASPDASATQSNTSALGPPPNGYYVYDEPKYTTGQKVQEGVILTGAGLVALGLLAWSVKNIFTGKGLLFRRSWDDDSLDDPVAAGEKGAADTASSHLSNLD